MGSRKGNTRMAIASLEYTVYQGIVPFLVHVSVLLLVVPAWMVLLARVRYMCTMVPLVHMYGTRVPSVVHVCSVVTLAQRALPFATCFDARGYFSSSLAQ